MALTEPTTPDPPYELIYWPDIPGRGEFIRLCLEEARATYRDTAAQPTGLETVLTQISPDNRGDAPNPPPLAPPILKHGGLVIAQTANILLYLAPRLGLAPPADSDPLGIYRVNQLVLTALDGLCNEPHDCHHPVATGLYYEEQRDEAKRRATDYLANRLPKFLAYFERVLKAEAGRGGDWLYGAFSSADLVLFQGVDGVKYMFPKALERIEREGSYARVFALWNRVRERTNVKAYLESERRRPYGMGIYRQYPELDEA